MLHYLFVFCLIITKIEINVAQKINSTIATEKSPTNGEDFLNIQTQLLEIQDDIISITNALGQNNNLNVILRRMTVTKDTFRLIADKLTNEIHGRDECSQIATKMLTNHYQAVSAQLKNLQSNVKDFKLKRLPLATIADIKEFKFDSAQEKLKELKEISDVSEIVQDLYASSSDSFELLANLIESLTDKDLIFNCVRALHQYITTHGYGDPYKWMRMANLMEAGVIHQPDVKLEIKTNSKNVVDELYQSIRVFVVNSLKANAKIGAFEKNGAIYNLTMAVYLFDPSHSESIITEFVEESFENQENLKNIFDTIESHKYIQQRITGIITLFWKIKDSRRTNNNVLFDIASALYKIHSDDEVYQGLSRAKRLGVKRIIDSLPTCARNLYFLPSVCLWNKAKEGYLTAGNSTLNNDTERRNIFLSEDPLPGRQWNVQRIDGHFLFSSETYPSEYLYAADFNFNRDLRYVFSWIPGNNTDSQSKWNIRLNGDYCYIQSAAYNENMISSNYKTFEEDNIELSYVFTWSPKNEMGKDRLQWQIRKCD